MRIIWKRPDGFQNAQPADFRTVKLSNGAQLWLHRVEVDWYPFQVSGDWSSEADTKKLNRLINMLDCDRQAWQLFLETSINNSLDQRDDNLSVDMTAKEYIDWLNSLIPLVDGNTWAVEIVRCALSDVLHKLNLFLH